MSQEIKETVYSRNTIEFVTVAVQYCAFLENTQNESASGLIDKLTKLLPLLYLKTSLVPDTEALSDDEPEVSVHESDYNYLLQKLSAHFGENDTYLEVFLEDMKYSETPISASISEDLTDIYQDLKNFTSIYEYGIDENMYDALHLCIENFKTYWGQKLANVLRALHTLKYTITEDVGEEESEESFETELW